MRIHALLHASFETIGSIETWVNENHYTLTQTHSYLNESLPSIHEFDLLIIMGGPQSPRERDIYPYLSDEIDLIKQSIEANKFVLGICLGAQLIGEALGAPVLKSSEKEIGIWPIHLTEEGKSDPLFQSFENSFDVIHWHNDMPGIPKNAVLLANSSGCPHQAFRYNDRVYGFQFHMEINEENAKMMCLHCPNDFASSKFTQPQNLFLKSDFNSINNKLNLILNLLTKNMLETV